jgi:hypothetical protein
MTHRIVEIELPKDVYQWLTARAEAAEASAVEDYAAQLLQQIAEAVPATEGSVGVNEDSPEGEFIAKRLRSLGYM